MAGEQGAETSAGGSTPAGGAGGAPPAEVAKASDSLIKPGAAAAKPTADKQDGGTQPELPEFLREGGLDKFWDAEKKQLRSEALAKSYRELQSKLGAFTGAPKPNADGKVVYDLKLPEGVTGAIDANDPAWEAVCEVAAAQSMSQEALNAWVALQATVFAADNLAGKDAEVARLRGMGYSEAKTAELWQFFEGRTSARPDIQGLIEEVTAFNRGGAAAVHLLDWCRTEMLRSGVLEKGKTDMPAGGGAVTLATVQARYSNPLQTTAGAEGEAYRAETTRLAQIAAGERAA